ncbi:MAG: thiamine-phosphate kinase [Rhodospirillaceae bacterium]|nr:thiamine-phosphate kinase [Rhodospirillaceae bacterium]|tara:strand:- start:873 stop:1859 length:987 start_codon:yes stop_codon:yes gene_type:complete
MGLDEFDRIKKYFKPLASAERGSLDLLDDAAVLPIGSDSELVISTDALVEGIHYVGDEDASLIAQKSLRTNLSDMAAMGAAPWAYTLSLILDPLKKCSADQWLDSFVAGLQIDQNKYDVRLIGGDSVVGAGPTVISITIIGKLNNKGPLVRSGALQNDDIYVSGTIGDSAAGLQVIKGSLDFLDFSDQIYLKNRYYLPQPRVALGLALVGLASAAMDVSDGLIQDMGHLCSASGLAAVINWPNVPLSPPVITLLESKSISISAIINGGDDYELLFTAPSILRPDIEELSKKTEVSLTRIGYMTEGADVLLMDKENQLISLAGAGFKHA